MIRSLAAMLQRRLGLPTRDPATEPLLAGYRRGVSPRMVLTLLTILAIACFVYGYFFAIAAPARMMPFTIPVAVMLGMIIWALPPGDYAPTRAIEPVFVLFFVSLVVWPNYLAIALPSLPWLTLLRI